MCKARLGKLLVILLLAIAIPGATARAQNFGNAFQHKKIVLVRKLPPAGHIDGSTFTVNVNGGGGAPGDVTAVLKSTIESIIISNDPRLRTVTPQEHPDAIINCQIISYAQPAPVNTQSAGISFNHKPAPPVTTSHVTGMMKANFNAQDVKGGRSIAANTVTIKYDQEFVLPQAAPASKVPSFGSIISAAHIPTKPAGQDNKSGPSDEADQPPTPVELRDWLVQNTAMGIASLLVNTTEQVPVNLAVGGGLDDADRLMDQKLWTRALEGLGTMPPFASPDQDAYRLYDLGVVNEALGYSTEDVTKASRYLQEAAIDYGKAIDAKPAEKNFLQPQTRIDTALAHYKTLSDQQSRSQQMQTVAATPAPAADALTNADVISMVAAKLDEANILDTIKTATVVKFDLSAHGQIDLAKGSVNGRIIAAMKAKTRGK